MGRILLSLDIQDSDGIAIDKIQAGLIVHGIAPPFRP